MGPKRALERFAIDLDDSLVLCSVKEVHFLLFEYEFFVVSFKGEVRRCGMMLLKQ